MVKINHKSLCENCFAETDREPCPICGYSRTGYNGDPMTLSPGSILEGRYAVGRVIGKGGFGMTYLAYDMKLECKVAVKEYYPRGLAMRSPGSTFVSVSDAESEVTFKEGAGKFYDEARLVAKFNGNPNIVSVYDFFYGNDTVYFTMGYLDGMTLKSYLKEYGALSLAQAVYVAESVSSALMAAHSMNVLHRDISPDNIMVCKDGTIKLLDFGAARQVVTEGSQSLSVILKQGFAPLEQYQKKGKQGPWTDIYSLGATLYHALTLDILDDPMSRLEDDEEYSANCHRIDEGFWQVIKKATALRIADRYQDIFEMRKELNSLHIKPEMLVEPEAAADMTGQGPTAKAFGSTARRQEEAAVGVTMPLQEEAAVGVTMPLREEAAVGVTMPLQEEDTVGVTMPLQEENAVGVAMPLQESKKEGITSSQAEDAGMTVPLQTEDTAGKMIPPKEKEEAGMTMPLMEEQMDKDTRQKVSDEVGEMTEKEVQTRKKWYETERRWIFEMLGIVVVQLVSLIALILLNASDVLEDSYLEWYEYDNNWCSLVIVITAAEGMILFALEQFCLQPEETGNRMVSKKEKIIRIMILVVINIVTVGIAVPIKDWGMFIMVPTVVGGIAFALDTFVLQPVKEKTIKEQVKKYKIIFFTIMAGISIITAVMDLWHARASLSLGGHCSPFSLMAILEEGILLVTLDAVFVSQYSFERKSLKNIQRRIQQNAILLYFILEQMFFTEAHGHWYSGEDIEIILIALFGGFAVIFLLYFKKSRICAILISIFAGSLLCINWEWVIEENLYILVLALLSLPAVYLTFYYHNECKKKNKWLSKQKGETTW